MPKITKATVFVLFLFWSYSSIAQNTSLYNVKLKSGLIIKGTLLRIVPDSFIVIKQYGALTTIKISEVQSIEQSGSINPKPESTVAPKKKIVLPSLPGTEWTSGFQIGISLNNTNYYGPGFGNRFGFSTLKGLDSRWEVGFSAGLDVYLDFEEVFGTIMGQARYYFKKDAPRSTIFYTQAGYGFNLSAVNIGGDGGFTGGIGLGNASRMKKGGVFTIRYGLKFQNARYEVSSRSWGVTTTNIETYVIAGLEAQLEWRF